MHLTVDIESDWGGRVNTVNAVVELVPRLLDILSENNSKATFFISTEYIDVYASAVMEIYQAGHEIASHGHRHNVHYDELSRNDLRNEIMYSAKLLEELTGAKVVGFRTPQFRKNVLTEEILLDSGYEYDSSSVNTSLEGRYKSRQYECGLIPEYPVSSVLGKFPAGVKWINLLKAPLDKKQESIVYLHMFDLLSMTQIFSNSFGKNLPLKVQAFYAARIGSPFATVNNILKDYGPSRTIKSALKGN